MSLPADMPFPIPRRVRELAGAIASEARLRFGSDLRVYWFGSWITGRARPHSDIDLALEAGTPLPHRELAALRAWIDELPTLYSVDLLDLHQVGETLRRRVLEEGLEL